MTSALLFPSNLKEVTVADPGIATNFNHTLPASPSNVLIEILSIRYKVVTGVTNTAAMTTRLDDADGIIIGQTSLTLQATSKTILYRLAQREFLGNINPDVVDLVKSGEIKHRTMLNPGDQIFGIIGGTPAGTTISDIKIITREWALPDTTVFTP